MRFRLKTAIRGRRFRCFASLCRRRRCMLRQTRNSTCTSRRAGSTQDSVAQRAQLVTETAPAAWVLEPSEMRSDDDHRPSISADPKVADAYAQPSRLTCDWCARWFRPRRTGSRPQRFCCGRCPRAYERELRAWARNQITAGTSAQLQRAHSQEVAPLGALLKQPRSRGTTQEPGARSALS